MKARIGLHRALGLLLLIACARSALAGGAGSTSFDFLNLSLGARQTAMGGSGVAVADDLYASHLNPAALGRLWRHEAGFLYTRWFEDVSYQYLGYAYPTSQWGTFAASLYQLGYGDIQGFDTSGKRTSVLTAKDSMGQLSYGRQVSGRIWTGLNLKYAHERLHTETAGVFAGDLGLLYQPNLTGWLSSSALGLSVRNIGRRPKFIQESARLPASVQAGVAIRPFFEGLTLTADATKVQSGEISAQAGAEYLAKNVVAFRVGYNSAYDLGSGLAFGAGFKAWNLQFDYAFAGFSGLGSTHHLGLTFRFGSLAETHYDRGMQALREKDYPAAIVEFGKTLSLNHQHRRALLRMKETNELLQEHLRQLNH